MSDLRTAIEHLAHDHPEFRAHLVPLLRKTAGGDWLVTDKSVKLVQTLIRAYPQSRAVQGKPYAFEIVTPAVTYYIEVHEDEFDSEHPVISLKANGAPFPVKPMIWSLIPAMRAIEETVDLVVSVMTQKIRPKH